MASLELVTGANAGKRYQLHGETIVIGRDPFPHTHVQLRERTVSRRHARILVNDGKFFIEDLGSLNGTRVNGAKISGRSPLQEGDMVHLYDVLLVFHQDEAALADDDSAIDDLASYEEANPPEGRSGIGLGEPSVHTPLEAGLSAKLDAILEINRNLGKSLQVDHMLANLLEGLFKVFPQSDRGYILIAEGDQDRLFPKAYKDQTSSSMGSATFGPVNRTLVKKVFDSKDPVLAADDGTVMNDAVLDSGGRTAMCVPLTTATGSPLGVLYLDTNDSQLRFTQADLEVLTNISAVAAQSLDFARMHAAQIDQQKRNNELAMARRVQKQFLPIAEPEAAGYSFAHVYESAREVGGDYLGYVSLADGRVAFAIGDVSGKGVSAALLMARLCSEVRYCVSATDSAEQAVQKLNREICSMPLEDAFVTFCLGVLEPGQHRLTLVNAGHLPPLLRSKDRQCVTPLAEKTGGMPLGIDADAAFPESTHELSAGDLVFLFTDGLTEAYSSELGMYGLARVKKRLLSGPDSNAKTLGEILGDVRKFTREVPQSDDICMIGVAREKASV